MAKRTKEMNAIIEEINMKTSVSSTDFVKNIKENRAISLLKKIAIKKLTEQDTNWIERVDAIKTIGHLGGNSAILALSEVANKTNDLRVRIHALNEIRKLNSVK